jgi:hypothetical protein
MLDHWLPAGPLTLIRELRSLIQPDELPLDRVTCGRVAG